MRKIQLPGTRLNVSHICLGTAQFGLHTNQESSFRLMDTFVESGGNFIDTAHCYADWAPGELSRSEKMIGHWIKARKNRSDIVLATKGGIDFRSETGICLSESELDKDIEESLGFLQTDYIDLYWLHRDERTRPVDQIVKCLNKHIKAGHIHHAGCSNWLPDRIIEANDYARANGMQPFIASQLEWSLARMFKPENPFDRGLPFMDQESLAFHRSTHLTAVAFSAQARGFFSTLDTRGEDGLSPLLREHLLNDRNRETYKRLKKLSAETGCGITALCLSYINSQTDFVAVPIIFTSAHDHLLDCLTGADTHLTHEQVSYLEHDSATST